jgi:hypothetical protein
MSIMDTPFQIGEMGMTDPVVGTVRQLSRNEARLLNVAQINSGELVGQMVPLEDMRKLREWMREPDHAEQCDLAWLLDWVNRRPLSVLY